MKEKIKEFSKSYLVGLILGIIVSGTVSVIAATYFPSNDVTYDNTDSGLQSTNVQSAIDELYGVCFPPSAGDQIIEDGGLEKDPYECRYFFTGANPNNYITFNGETAGWRILSVECDGTIKIVRNETVERKVWDTSNSNNWTRPATLNTYLNETYLKSLSSTAKNQIVSHDFSIGAVTLYNNDLAGQVNDENSSKWNGKIALPTASEYLRTNSNSSNCGTFSLISNNPGICKNTTWMYTSINWYTITSQSSNATNVYFVYDGDGDPNDGSELFSANADISAFIDVRPTLYLSSEAQITGGSGTQSDPYTIE